ncbi:MAG TPA: ABC transporter substrate-binding protein [Acetobacteraceae bacterium]|nr:ABC transporter substrate-binding protein [Acetobacteraceae bacterium]
MLPIRRRVLLGAGLAGLAAPKARAVATATQPAAAEPLPIGALFPFSGPLSLLGDESFRGLDLAADERNAAGGLLGRRIVLRRGDAGSEPAGTAEAKRLLGAEHVAMVFGTLSSTVCLAASAVTEAAGVAYFELDALGDALMERGFRLLFRSGVAGSACGILAVDTVADLLVPGWQMAPQLVRLLILHQDGPAGASIAAAAQARAAARGLAQVENITYAGGMLDFAPIVRRLRGSGAEVVLHSGLQTDVLLFHRAMQQAGWRPRMVIGTGGGYALADTAQALGAAFEGVMSVGVPPYRVSEVVAPGAAQLAAAYQRKYGAPPRAGHSLACFAGARAFFDAIARAGTLDRDRLRAAVLATDIPDGASIGGSGVQFDSRGQNRRARPFLAQWQNGTLVTIGPTIAAVAPASVTLGG